MKVNNKYFKLTIEKKKHKKNNLIKMNFETKMPIKKIIADLVIRLIKLICSLVVKLISQMLVAIILDYIMNRLFYKQLILCNKRMIFL